MSTTTATTTKATHELLPEVRAEIDKWVAKFPPERKQSAVLPALRIVQEAQGGWLPEVALNAVADYLEVPRIAVYEVATFYTMYDLKPTGRHKLYVCTNVSCMLSGAYELLEHLKKKLNIDVGETTEDGEFTLKEEECLGACAGAPVIFSNHNYFEHMTPESVDDLLEQLRQQDKKPCHALREIQQHGE